MFYRDENVTKTCSEQPSHSCLGSHPHCLPIMAGSANEVNRVNNDIQPMVHTMELLKCNCIHCCPKKIEGTQQKWCTIAHAGFQTPEAARQPGSQAVLEEGL